MQKRFWINETQVDTARNTLSRHGEEISLQPKMIAVLSILARHQGDVVSHNQLMDDVWPEAEVSPNTLQRCIAQLRKALGDDSRAQKIIKTHSKQGYSLEAQVSWGNEHSLKNVAEPQSTKPLYLQKEHSPFILSVAVMTLILLAYFMTSNDRSLKYQQVSMLTTSDEKEYFPNYSPDGRYLVFHRYIGACENHLWAKDLETQQEYPLTRTPGIYASHSWSADGNQLALIKQEKCLQLSGQNDSCWRLLTVDFAQALQQPIDPVERLGCDSHFISTVEWMNNGNILLLKEMPLKDTDTSEFRLMLYDVRTRQLNDFYRPKAGKLYDFTYSKKLNQLVVISKDQHLKHFIERLDAQGTLLERNQIETLSTDSVFQSYSASFHPSGEFLITNLQSGLHQMSLEGELFKIETPDNLALSAPRYHPSERKIVATSGVVDMDIARIELAAFTSHGGRGRVKPPLVGFNQVHLPFPSISRSTRTESHARFHPDGKTIAFVSQRGEGDQLWLYENGQSRQLSHFKQPSSIRSLTWSPDGMRVAIVSKDSVLIFDLDGKEMPLTLDRPIRRLFEWTAQNQLIVSASGKTSRELSLVDVNSGKVSELGYANAQFARQFQKGLLLMDAQSRLWVVDGEGKRQINIPSNMLASPPVLSDDKSLYGLSHEAQLWRFDLTTQKLEIIATIDENVWWLMDEGQGQILAAQAISARKEIVELSPR